MDRFSPAVCGILFAGDSAITFALAVLPFMLRASRMAIFVACVMSRTMVLVLPVGVRLRMAIVGPIEPI